LIVAVALIVAAGSGERLGLGRPKAFVPLAGRPLLAWSVDALRAVPAIERIVVALPEGEEAPEGTVGVPGGGVRSESVRRALAAADGLDPVLVHDAARPLLTPGLAGAVLDGLGGADAAIAAAPVTDTVKEAGTDRLVTATLDRSRLWSVQTPQVFTHAALQRALDVDPQTLAEATDDAWLVERLGGSVRIVPAPPENLKVTSPLDLRLAELLLAERAPATG
jgi:2-C-methyl-D-erythritol 4-phosphate cytidylyltransferase